MQSLSVSNQTLSQFMEAPFGISNKLKNLKYEDRYQAYKKANKIKIEASTELDGDYFIHLKVPSESSGKEVSYDVVVQFFAPDDNIRKSLDVKNYYVQFFSNSPGFMYKYAALYKLQGYLIESLYSKFADGALDVLPDKANKNYELSFDSTIYYACRHLLDNSFNLLNKVAINSFHKRTPQQFFDAIDDTEGVEISRDINKLQKEIARDRGLSLKKKQKLKKNQGEVFREEIKKDEEKRKEASLSTFKDKKLNGVKKIIAKQTTLKSSSQSKKIGRKPKKIATSSTTKK